MLTSLLVLLSLTFILGILYPFCIFFLGQIFFSHKANGSLIVVDGKVIGSALIGQNFQQNHYFHPRPSSAGKEGYDASNSMASNFSATSQIWKQKTEELSKNYREINHLSPTTPIPIDAITASGSGLDPHISPENARLQISRIAQARQLSEKEIEDLVVHLIEEPYLEIFGQPRINVLLLNQALDQLQKEKK